jgi:hypothetical protein
MCVFIHNIYIIYTVYAIGIPCQITIRLPIERLYEPQEIPSNPMSPRDGLGTDNVGLDGAEGTALADLAEAERRGRLPDLASLKAVTTVTGDFTSQ